MHADSVVASNKLARPSLAEISFMELPPVGSRPGAGPYETSNARPCFEHTQRDRLMNPTTVELLNQSAPLVDYNLFSSHSALVDALATLLEGAAGRDARFDRYRDALLAELGEADGNELRARDLT